MPSICPSTKGRALPAIAAPLRSSLSPSAFMGATGVRWEGVQGEPAQRRLPNILSGRCSAPQTARAPARRACAGAAWCTSWPVRHAHARDSTTRGAQSSLLCQPQPRPLPSPAPSPGERRAWRGCLRQGEENGSVIGCRDGRPGERRAGVLFLKGRGRPPHGAPQRDGGGCGGAVSTSSPNRYCLATRPREPREPARRCRPARTQTIPYLLHVLELDDLRAVCLQLDFCDLVRVAETCKRFRYGDRTAELPTKSPVLTAPREHAFPGGELIPSTRPVGCFKS